MAAASGGERTPAGAAGSLRGLSTRELVAELAAKGILLAKSEIALAKSEAREDLRTELRMASGLGVAGACALCTLNLLLVAVVFALAEAAVMRGWLAALLVAAVVLAIGSGAGLASWRRRVRQPLDATRRSLEASVRWARERLA